MKRFGKFVLKVVVILVICGAILGAIIRGISKGIQGSETVSQNSILVIELKGIIMDSDHFIEELREYSEQPNIRGVLIRVDSPGGVVGPSQEIYAELKRVRESGKPVYVSAGSLMASGAYYSAVAADQIYVNPGTLVGSIGVIMEFANLSKLYDWAKVDRYSLKTGRYKDVGADYRPMTDDEKKLMLGTMYEVLDQFKAAVQEGRKDLKKDILDANADGRILTGASAVRLGFADHIGTSADALSALGERVGLGTKPETFEPPKKIKFGDFLSSMSEESRSWIPKSLLHSIAGDLLGRPLYLMPGVLPDSGSARGSR